MIKQELFADQPINVIAWCDSTIVLRWLSDIPRKWKTFIGNRTSYILDVLPRVQWRYVPSKDNPADLISRGVNPSKFVINNNLWFHGPNWLQQKETNWPHPLPTLTPVDDTLLELRPSVFLNVPTQPSSIVNQLLATCSSYFKIKKIMVYVLRFCKRYKSSPHPTRTSVTLSELLQAENTILCLIQKEHFQQEVIDIRSDVGLRPKSMLLSLDPFVDDIGLLRVGGRLRYAQLPYSHRFPVILPKAHPINMLIIKEAHHLSLHGGIQLMLSIVRKKYWIIDARTIARQVLRKCVVCIRHRTATLSPKMGDLPPVRVTKCRPFVKCGLDYAGPIQIKTSILRNASYSKAYIALFVCMVTKAVHLEIVSSLDTDSFITALRRFVARRGYPSEIWCDNGLNFVGANSELQRLRNQIMKQLENNHLSTFCLQNHIQFHFNPPRAPHFGGLWEATVKSTKFHLVRVMGSSKSTYEGVNTILNQIEAILNSRPLCRIHDNVDDIILTPAHFLIGDALVAIPEPDIQPVRDNLLNLYQNMQKRVQGFWARWHQDYLHTLQQRTKWQKQSGSININDIVLIRDLQLPPTKWALAKVISIYPGQDGIVRVVKVKTHNAEFIRSTSKLIKLPVTTYTPDDIHTASNIS